MNYSDSHPFLGMGVPLIKIFEPEVGGSFVKTQSTARVNSL